MFHFGFSYVGILYLLMLFFLIFSGRNICLKDMRTAQRKKTKYCLHLKESVRYLPVWLYWSFLTLIQEKRYGLHGLLFHLFLWFYMRFTGFVILRVNIQWWICTVLFLEFRLREQLFLSSPLYFLESMAQMYFYLYQLSYLV